MDDIKLFFFSKVGGSGTKLSYDTTGGVSHCVGNQHWKHYLDDKVVKTDHKPLVNLKTQKYLSKRQILQAEWRQHFNMKIMYVEWKSNLRMLTQMPYLNHVALVKIQAD